MKTQLKLTDTERAVVPGDFSARTAAQLDRLREQLGVLTALVDNAPKQWSEREAHFALWLSRGVACAAQELVDATTNMPRPKRGD